jgi:hypothetical protein
LQGAVSDNENNRWKKYPINVGSQFKNPIQLTRFGTTIMNFKLITRLLCIRLYAIKKTSIAFTA